MKSGRGFTLIEMMVVIAVIAVLLAVLKPAALGVRQAMLSASSLVTMRQMSVGLSLYAGDFNQYFPFYGVPGAPGESLTIGEQQISTGGGGQFFELQSRWWTSHLQGNYFQGTPRIDGRDVFGEEQHPNRRGVFWCRYWLTHTVLATSDFWTDNGPYSLASCRGVRTTQVLFPSRKGILIDLDLLGREKQQFSSVNDRPRDVARVAFADGSVRAEPWLVHRNIAPGEVFPPMRVLSGFPIMATRDGVRGQDY